MKQAQIKCPHCGKPITVRQIEPIFREMTADMQRIFKAAFAKMDEAFELLGKAFK
jgi:hypothetical protein